MDRIFKNQLAQRTVKFGRGGTGAALPAERGSFALPWREALVRAANMCVSCERGEASDADTQ